MKKKPLFYSVLLTNYERDRFLQGVVNDIEDLEQNMDDLSDSEKLVLDRLRRLRFRLEDCAAVY